MSIPLTTQRCHGGAQRRLWAVLLVSVVGCTEIAPVKRAKQDLGEAGSTSRLTSAQAQASADDSTMEQERERCDAQPGATGPCQAPAPECVGRPAGEPFCNGVEQWVCANELSSTQVMCPNHERCVTRNHLASCDCVPGAKRDDSGACVVGMGCPDGACDAKTECSIVNGERSCSMCPQEYSGDGVSGCAPLLLGVTLSCGTLDVALSKDVFDYRIAAPLVCQSVTLQAQAPVGAELDVNGHAIEGESWSSPPLALGDNTINLTVTEPATGVNNAYRMTIEHSARQTQALRADNPKPDDFFGTEVALDGDTMVIGAPNTDAAGLADSGAAYVFAHKNGRWAQAQQLEPVEPLGSEFFGGSVAVSGDTIVVGATGSDPSAWPPNRNRSGAAYVFLRSAGTWSQIAKLTPSSATGGDGFGRQMLLSGNTLLIAAPYDSTVASEAGAIYIYERGPNGFREAQKVVPSRPGPWTSIGSSLALEGDTFVVGGCTDGSAAYDAGVAYVFVRRGGMWQEQQILDGPPIRDATFGFSAALSGDLLAIGAPRAQRVKAGEMDSALPAGEVYMFKREGERWVQTSVLKAPVPRPSDRFGTSVILTPSLLAIGAMGDASSARAIQGNQSDNSAPGSGAVHLYARQAGEPTHTTFVKSADSAAGIALGRKMAASLRMLVVGAPYESEARSGAVFVFE